MTKGSGIISGLIIGGLFLLLSFRPMHAQLLDPVSYQISYIPAEVKAGAVFELKVVAFIDENWHLYSTLNDPDAGPHPTSFTSSSDQMVLAGDVKETMAEIAYDPNFDTELGWHSDRAEFRIPIAFKPGIRGEQTLKVDVYYQACDNISCLPPREKTIVAPILLLEDADPEFIVPEFLNSNQENVSTAESQRVNFVYVSTGFLLIIGMVVLIIGFRVKGKSG